MTKDVAGNIAQASSGVKEANQRVAQTATVGKSIAQDISQVNATVNDLRSGGEQVQASAAELSHLAEQLKAVVKRFQMQNGSQGSSSVASSKVHKSADKPGQLITWNDSYSVGVLTMDSHHKRLIDLINRFHAAIKSGEGIAQTGAILKEVATYTRFHFKAEEDLMRKANYSGFAAQEKAHNAFVRSIESAQERLLAGDSTVTQSLLDLLEKWLVQHIVTMDKQYEAAVNKNSAHS